MDNNGIAILCHLISEDSANNEIFCAKVDKGDIKIVNTIY